MNRCCEPCPWCGLEIDYDEVNLGDDWGWYHWCPDGECGWSDYIGRDITKEEWDAL